MGAVGRDRGHPSPQRSPGADTGGIGLCTQCPVSSGSESAACEALLITSWGAHMRDSQAQAPAFPLWRVLLVPSPLRAGSGLVPMRWHFPHRREGPSWCRPSPQARPRPEDIGEALCFYASLYKWYFF
uniref:Uncharacterized protein n=1 Tax=Pipistrellus kuhlii TaxID=59472 RepID=A0A7J8A855_PIPKU|nr:hypothetical protein mPipKuh1_008809 [Pipistrellus kuhlii]